MPNKADTRQDSRYWGSIPMPQSKAEFFNALTTPSPSGSSTVATIRMYGPIDSWGGFWGISTKDVGQVLDALPDSVDQIILRINSPGGEVFEGISILNMLRAHKATVLAVVDGLAASAASVIAAGADETVMSPGTQMMIHSPWSFAMGNSTEFRKSADVLDGLETSLVEIYAAKAGDKDWAALLADETWLNASDTVDLGLADRVAVIPDAGEAETVGQDDAEVLILVPDDDGDAQDAAAKAIRITARTFAASTDLPTHPEPGHEQDAPATNPKEDAVADAVVDNPQAPANAPAPFNMADLTSAFRAALKEEGMASVPSPALPSSLAGAPVNEKQGPSFAEAMNIFAARKTGMAPAEATKRVESTLTNGSEVFASLTNIGLTVNGNTGGLQNTVQPQWIGELVQKVPYSGLWDLVAHDDLTSRTSPRSR
jgi:ATP-dependent protease ClpP protease subunit